MGPGSWFEILFLKFIYKQTKITAHHHTHKGIDSLNKQFKKGSLGLKDVNHADRLCAAQLYMRDLSERRSREIFYRKEDSHNCHHLRIRKKERIYNFLKWESNCSLIGGLFTILFGTKMNLTATIWCNFTQFRALKFFWSATEPARGNRNRSLLIDYHSS